MMDAQDGRGTELVPANPDVPAAPVKKKTKASTVVLSAGGIAMGLGLTLVGVGFAASSATGTVSLWLGLTFGALLGIAGIVTLIIGLVMLAAGK
jgi:hypothetical protein